jgi:hypothetical protein
LTSVASDQRSVASEKVRSPSNLYRSLANEVPFHDTRNIIKGHVSVPDIVRKDEDYRPLFMTASAGISEHRRRRKT